MAWLSLLLFLPWFCVMGALYWWFPRQPRHRAGMPGRRAEPAPAPVGGDDQAHEQARPQGAVAQHVGRAHVAQLAEEQREETPDAISTQAKGDAGESLAFIHGSSGGGIGHAR
mgnify:CR=1 FL=1